MINESIEHELFKPVRLCALILKSIRSVHPDMEIWRQPPYEYEKELMPIDMLSGNSVLRNWVDDPDGKITDLEDLLISDEQDWARKREPFLLY